MTTYRSRLGCTNWDYMLQRRSGDYTKEFATEHFMLGLIYLFHGRMAISNKTRKRRGGGGGGGRIGFIGDLKITYMHHTAGADTEKGGGGGGGGGCGYTHHACRPEGGTDVYPPCTVYTSSLWCPPLLTPWVHDRVMFIELRYQVIINLPRKVGNPIGSIQYN